MKTKLLLLILLIVGSIGMGTANGESAAEMRPPVKFLVKFLKSRTGCVEPRGICTELILYATRNSDPNFTTCDITYEFNTLTLQVSKSNISEAARKSLVGFNSLPIDADFTFSNESSRALGSLNPITIKVGDYPIRETIDGYTLTFPCK
jgi:hypothetical protein